MKPDSTFSRSPRQWVALALVLFQLGLGTAWAFDWHAPHAGDHVHTLSGDDAGQHFDGDACDDACDEGCHLTSHLLGLLGDSVSAVYPAVSAASAPVSMVYRSRVTDPPA